MCIKPSETQRNHSAQNSSKTRRTMSWLKSCILNTSVSFIDCPNFKFRMLLLFAKLIHTILLLFFKLYIFQWANSMAIRHTLQMNAPQDESNIFSNNFSFMNMIMLSKTSKQADKTCKQAVVSFNKMF